MVALKRDLSLFDLTNIIIGAVIGSDIYIASALTANPSSARFHSYFGWSQG